MLNHCFKPIRLIDMHYEELFSKEFELSERCVVKSIRHTLIRAILIAGPR